jgi:hypothetical protein
MRRVKPTGAHRILVEQGELLSWLVLPDMTEEQAAPAVVRFSPEEGVTALLLDAPEGWPTDLGYRGDLVVHGATVEGGHRFTILEARVDRLALGGKARRLHASTLALDAHLDRDTR